MKDAKINLFVQHSTRNFIKDLKRSPTYTEAIGVELGIVGSSAPFDPAVYKSVLRVSMHPGYVTVRFIKKGAEGINLYSRQNGETNWTKLGFFGHSPCTDARTVPKAGQAINREYMCIGVLKDHEIGVQSDIISLAFAG